MHQLTLDQNVIATHSIACTHADLQASTVSERVERFLIISKSRLLQTLFPSRRVNTTGGVVAGVVVVGIVEVRVGVVMVVVVGVVVVTVVVVGDGFLG